VPRQQRLDAAVPSIYWPAYDRRGAQLAVREGAMAERLGAGDWTYEVNENWAKIPDDIVLGDCAAVGVDSKGNVYAFNRGEHPVAVFDNDGNLLRTWGEGVFTRPHGVHVAPDDTIWLTDDGDHTVRHCTLDGRVLMTLGVPGKPAPFMSGEPFHRCTHTALSPQCDHLFISDGYGNARVHKYTVDGKLLHSWGESGTDPGQFNIAHNICCDPDGWVYVADRENHRVQVFDGNGKYEAQWNNMHRPSGLYMEAGTRTPRFFVGEIGPDMAVNIELPNCGPRVSIYTHKGELLARLGDRHAGLNPGQFISPHGITVDSRGDIYVGEVSFTNWGRRVRARGEDLPPGLRSLQKLVKVS
jgi:DNA-binding beta-propeller fold protein YncE